MTTFIDKVFDLKDDFVLEKLWYLTLIMDYDSISIIIIILC